MESQEIVRRAIEFDNPPRLPFFLGGSWSGKLSDVIKDFPNDVCDCWEMDRQEKGWFFDNPAPDDWGSGWKKTEVDNMGQVVHHPLEEWSKLTTFKSPNPRNPFYFERIEESIQDAGHRYVVITSHFNLFERLHMLHGFFTQCLPFILIIIFLMAAPLFASIVSDKGLGKQKVLVIMVKFPDVQPSFSREKMREKYFGKLDRYLQAISYKKTWIEGKITDWYLLPHNVGHYHLSQHNLEVEKDRVTKLIQDAINLADKDEDFSQYSMIFLSLGAKQKDYGMMGLCGYPGMLGWQNQLPMKTKGKNQEIPGGVAIYCENAHVGVVFHDMAHIMGGVQKGKRVLPCLYDHDLQAQKGSFRGTYKFYLINVGFYDPMSCHFHDLSQGPPGVCAWTKMRLNWIEPQKKVEVVRGKSKTLNLGPLSSGKSEVQVVKLPINSTTYYLIENRQAIGPDKNLPSHGVLIYYCDDRIAECRHGKSPVKLIDADPSIPQLKCAPFTCDGNRSFNDEKHNISIKLVSQNRESFKIFVSNK